MTFKFLVCKHMRDNLQFCCSHLCCSHFTKCKTKIFRMTDSMNFGPDWIRNLSSEGTTGGGIGGGTRYQLADYRYGREEMLALFDKNSKPPVSITNFKCLYSDTCLQPLALLPATEEERGGWQGRPNTIMSGTPRGRGVSLERGGRISRGRGGYQYGRPTVGYEGTWGNGEQPDWSPRKEYGNQRTSMDNWRRATRNEEDEWRAGTGPGRNPGHEKWGRSTSWRGEGDSEERTGPPERGGRTGWNDNRGSSLSRKSWESEDHLPEWAMENPTEGGGTFDEKGAFHGSDDEQLEAKPPNKRDTSLQKSTSQQHISTKNHPPSVNSSKSTLSLVKSEEILHKKDIIHEKSPKKESETLQNVKQKDPPEEKKEIVSNIPELTDNDGFLQDRAKSEGPPIEKQILTNGPVNDTPRPDDSDFERLQEDLVLKLVVDEDLPKQISSNFEVGNIQPPPNLVSAPPIIDKWFYQDPQGQMQGPFPNNEMAEWYKAGYFSNQLKVRRQCDERFFLLGELVTLCAGANPFQSGIRFPTLKNDITTKLPATEPDLLQLQFLQMAAYKQAQNRILTEPWNPISLQQQQELAAQRLILQQQQVTQDLYLQQTQATNPLMHMINQMQQANKLPGQGLVDKQPQNLSGALDPLQQLHMSNLLSMQNRLPATGLPSSIPAGLGNNLPGNLPQPEGLSTSMPSLQQTSQLNTGTLPIAGIQSNIPVSIGGSINIPRPTSRSSEQIPSSQNNDPISSLLKQLQQQKQPTSQVDTLWQQNSFPPNNGTAQWQSQNDVPISMWDIQNNSVPSPPLTQSEKLQQALQPKATKIDKEKEQKLKEEVLAKELKKKKELEEKLAKKEAEEKRKQEIKRAEAEKKMLEEKRKKEEERIKRELEKARKEAEEKRLRELEEKRKNKELRKQEEEARKRAEEQKKLEEERIRQDLREKEARRLEEEKRLQQEQIRMAKSAPWSQSNSNMGLSLAEIQKAEREKRALDAVLMQRLQEKEQLQIQQEKAIVPQFNWAKKPVEPRKVKSLAEIQAEEQEKIAKHAAESRLQKEKEPSPVINSNTGTSIWSSQNLTWATSSNNWTSNSGGFWDDSSSTQGAIKPSTVTKSNSANNFSTAAKPQQSQKPVKITKTKKEDTSKPNHNNNNNGPSTDEFMNWCYKTLSNISTNVDIPTFVTFLRDIESAFDVKEYCKEYLGDSNATHQFAVNFLEKRRSFKPKNNAHKDDMCSPAPAITPSLQHSTEFQEVKGKNKKNKKSKMLKVDSRILGFNVTSAPDRINVGDRDYGDNS